MLRRFDNLRCSSGEGRKVALGVLITNLTICDSLWAAVQPLIRESMSISWRDYGNRVSSTSERKGSQSSVWENSVDHKLHPEHHGGGCNQTPQTENTPRVVVFLNDATSGK